MREREQLDREARKRELKKNMIRHTPKEPERKRKKKKSIWLKIFLILGLLGVIGFLLNDFIISNLINYKNYSLEWSKELSQGSIVGYEKFNKYIIKYSKDGIVCLTQNAEELWIDSYEMKDPIIAKSSDYIAIADRQGKSIYIYDEKGRVGAVNTTLDISRISLADSGVLVALMEDDTSTSIQFYSKEGNPIDISVKNSLAGDGYPIDIAVSGDAKNLLVAYQYINNYKMSGRIVFYNFSEIGQNIPNRIVGGFDEDFADSFISKVNFSEGLNSYAIASSGVYFFSSKNILSPTITDAYLESSQISTVAYSEDYVATLIDDATGTHKYKLKVYSKDGKLLFEKYFDEEYDRISIDENYIFLYNDDSLLIYNSSAKEKFKGSLEFPVLKILKGGADNKLILLGSSKMNYIKLR